MTRILQQLINEGYWVTQEIVSGLNTCKTGHLNRFGQIAMRLDRRSDPVIEDLQIV